MALPQDFAGVKAVGESAERAWRLPMGAVSPLWSLFGAAAGVGIAYWWMTQWTKAVNVEALAGVAEAPAKVVAPKARKVEIIAEPSQALEPVVEAVVAHDVVEAAVEPVIEPVVEAIAEAPSLDDLTRMTGIGPKLSVALAERGVTRFAQIAAWTADDLTDVDVALSLKGRAVREAWVAQAKRLAGKA